MSYLVRIDPSYGDKHPRVDVIGPFAKVELDAFYRSADELGLWEPLDGGYVYVIEVGPTADDVITPAAWLAKRAELWEEMS